MKIKLFVFSIILFLSMLNISSATNKIYTANKKDFSQKLAGSFLKLYPDSIIYKKELKSRKWNYEQGLIEEAFFRMWKKTKDKKYFNYLKQNIDYYIRENGSIKTYNLDSFNLDNVASGRQLLHLYEITKEIKYKKAADTLRNQLRKQPRTKSGGFWHKAIYPDQMWLDGLYMAEPFYVQYAKLYNEKDAFDDIAKQFNLVSIHIKDSVTGLYYHGWDESKKQKWADPVKGTSPNFWGRSNGWLMMALVDVLDYFPLDHPDRGKIISMLKDLSLSLLCVRDKESKLWYQVLDKGDKKGNYLEASASLMIIYSFAKAYNKGYLDKRFLDAAKESFESAKKYFLLYDKQNIINLDKVVSVSGLGGNPYRDGSFEYYISEPIRLNDFKGYGPLILAAIELERSGKLKKQIPIAKKVIGLDNFYNNEWKNNKSFHYVWEDTTYSGFSELGNTIINLGAEITKLTTAPTNQELDKLSVYIIVDPDTQTETPKPNFIGDKEIKIITGWVKKGGVLVLLANDSANCEFTNLNLLAEKFGLYFNEVSINRVVGNNFDMGKIDKFSSHPVFKDVKKIYLKEISTLKLNSKAFPILQKDNQVIMAGCKFGKGFVFAVGDPWFYNEYFDNRKLPVGFENFKAAKNLFKWLINKANFVD